MAVLVYVEHWDGTFKKLSFELLSYASKVAEMMGTTSVALTIGNVNDTELAKLGGYGIGKILQISGKYLDNLDNQVFTGIIADVAKKEGASVLVLSNNNTGKALAPRLAVRLQAGVGSGVTKLPLSIDPFVVYKRSYSGNAFTHLQITSEVRILTLTQNAFGVFPGGGTTPIEKLTVDIAAGEVKTHIKDVQKVSGKILLTDAEIVVSGGRGMKSGDNWGPLLEMAELLGAATACSRPVSDEGWRPHEEHTGQTGKIIGPNLYFAIGISGATQHIAGVSGSKVIVAINNDKDAPVFESAQYGIIGDAQKVLPKLVEAIREMKGK